MPSGRTHWGLPPRLAADAEPVARPLVENEVDTTVGHHLDPPLIATRPDSNPPLNPPPQQDARREGGNGPAATLIGGLFGLFWRPSPVAAQRGAVDWRWQWLGLGPP
jgi:hypothetical protein